MSWPRVACASSDHSDSDRAWNETPTLNDDILAAALEDLEAGLTPLQVLDRYPQHEAELAALLQAAYDLRVTRWPVMSVAGRVAGRERMHAALAEQKRGRSGFLSPLWRQVGVSLALMLMAGTVFLASPLSPLDFPRKANPVTPTVRAPVLAAPTLTLTAPPATLAPTASSTVTVRPTTVVAVASAEPSETPERLIMAERTRAVAATATIVSSPTRRPTRANTPTPVATILSAATATPTQPLNSAVPTQAPPPTVIVPTDTPAPTPVGPSPTMTLKPTDPAKPTATATSSLPPTATRTARPTITTLPTPTPPPSPTATVMPRRTPKNTPKPTNTPEGTKTAESSSRAGPNPARANAWAASEARQEVREVTRTVRPFRP